MLLKMWVDLIIVSITLESIGMLVPSIMYRMSSIFRQDLNWGRWALWTSLESTELIFYIYISTTSRSDRDAILLDMRIRLYVTNSRP